MAKVTFRGGVVVIVRFILPYQLVELPIIIYTKVIKLPECYVGGCMGSRSQ